jgi:hypothetical protein
MTTEIIIKKMQKVIGVSSSSVLFGDARTQMASDLLRSLTDVIEKKADLDHPYYILVHATFDHGSPGGRTIKERIVLLDEKPHTKFLGTCCFRIDNKHGDAEVEWILPLDIPMPQWVEPEKANSGQVIVDSNGLPIYNRRTN